MVEGIKIKTTNEGFLADANDWNIAVATKIAMLSGIEISVLHWEILFFIRRYYQQFKYLPNSRVFTKTIKQEFGEKKGNSCYLYKLFPNGPLKYACKISGLPKPLTCF